MGGAAEIGMCMYNESGNGMDCDGRRKKSEKQLIERRNDET